VVATIPRTARQISKTHIYRVMLRGNEKRIYFPMTRIRPDSPILFITRKKIMGFVFMHIVSWIIMFILFKRAERSDFSSHEKNRDKLCKLL